MWVSRTVLLFVLSSAALAVPAAAATLSISPPWIAECTNGLGRATVTWEDAGPGPVQVRVGDRAGTPLTGWEAGSGSAITGDWVTDGMVFVLVNEQTAELARAVARVNCGGSPNAVEAALNNGAYFPLQLGNRWMYRVNSRLATSTYVSWTLTRSELIGERTYYVLTVDSGGDAVSEVRFRSDTAGRVYRRTAQGEQLWLDPTPAPDPSALLRIEGRGPATVPNLGTFPDAVHYNNFGGLTQETGAFAKGVGLAFSRTTMLTGSSGGFLSSMDLVDARISGQLRLAVAVPSVQLSAEATRLDVSGKRVTNCAVPCYFVACFLVPTTDPPNTYKPCFQARVGVTHPAANSVEIELADAAGRRAYRAALPLAAGSEAFILHQVPLYSSPNVGLPPGIYKLGATVRLPTGEAAGAASLTIQID